MKKSLTIVAVLLCSTALGHASAQPAAGSAGRASTSSQSAGDLQPDQAARTGRLPNGLRYVIYPNATPPGQVSVRMRIAAGDLMERDDQNGLAHFIEHMAFNGSRNIPEGQLIPLLERNGLAFGRETNAFTAPDQTVYQFDIPSSNDSKLDTALFVMREIAGEISFDQAAIERERGIILSEDRTTYPPYRRGFNARDAFLLDGQIISRRLDIGSMEVIRGAGRDLFLDYYRKYYRPERTTLVIVGDVDPEVVEARIRARFSDWQGAGPAGREPELGQPRERGFAATSFVLEGALREVSLSWLRPYVHAQDNRALRVRRLREALALDVLNRRFQRMIESRAAAFSAASAHSAQRYRSAEQVTVQATPDPGRYDDALRQIEGEIRRLTQHGVLEAELRREIAESRTALQRAAAGAATRPTPSIANAIVTSLNRDETILSPAQALALFEAAVIGYDGAAATAVARTLFTGSGPLLFATSPDPIEGGEIGLVASYEEARRSPVEPPVALAATPWPYERFGDPSQVVEREVIADLGVTRVRFANGVTLLVKPTEFSRGQIEVQARIRGGRQALAPELLTLPLTLGAFGGGGLEGLTEQQIRETLAGRVFSVSFSITDDSLLLRGTTRPQDFPTQLQLLAAYVAHPGWRGEAFEQKRSELQNLYNVINTSPLRMAIAGLPRLVRSSDARWGIPTNAELEAGQLAPVRAAIQPLLAGAPLEVVVVGDTGVEEAIAAVASTFGALPDRRPVASNPALSRVTFTPAAGEEVRLEHGGRPDVALGFLAWPTDDFFDNPGRAYAMQILREVLQIRMLERLREQLGQTYAPVILQEASEVFDEFGFLAIGAEVNADQRARLASAIIEVVESLKAAEITTDELARAREPLLQRLAQDRAGNDFWSARLAGSSWEPRRLETIRTQEALLRAATPALIRELAREYLDSSRAYRLSIMPRGANR